MTAIGNQSSWIKALSWEVLKAMEEVAAVVSFNAFHFYMKFYSHPAAGRTDVCMKK